MKTIVTHLNPDQDAVCSSWLALRFFPGWKNAKLEFVPAGETLNNRPPDGDPAIIHVDTGLGKFDHHHTPDKNQCASSLVLAEMKNKQFIRRNSLDENALNRMTDVVLDVDHAGDKLWPHPESDRYEFFLEPILDGLKMGDNKLQSEEISRFGFIALDGIFSEMKAKISAERIIAEGVEFSSPWGKGIGMETENDVVLTLAERRGYMMVVKKDPQKGNVRIYAHPVSGADLTEANMEISRRDPNSDWFLHASKKMLLNGSRANPKMRPTKLTLEEIIKILSKEVVHHADSRQT